MFKHTLAFAAVAALALSAGSALAQSRDQIRIVGSSTVFPFATAVAENFGKTGGFKTPVVESTGSGGGLKLFCAGVGLESPDITNASRRIKASEFKKCGENGITITEVKVGFDGIVMANSKAAPQFDLSLKQVFQALAAEVPVNGKLVKNPYRKWSDIDPALPDVKIEVMGPPPTSGTRDAFVEIAMEKGAKSFDMLTQLRKQDKKAFKAVAHTIREDGAFVEAGENDNLIVQKLEANPDSLGIFGFSFLDQNMDQLRGSIINGVTPTFEAISDGGYPVSRSLYFYVKQEHVGVVPGIQEYIAEFTGEAAWGPEGYLADRGLIPLSDDERERFATEARGLKALAM